MSMRRILFWLTLYIATLGGSYMLYHLALPIRVSYHALTLVGLMIYLYRRGLPDSPLTIPALLMLGAVLISIPFALDPRMAFENAWSWAVNLLMFLCLIQLCRDGYQETMFKAHFVAAAIVATIAILEFATSHHRPDGLFLSISITGAYAAALLVPTLNTLVESQDHRQAATYGLLIALLMATILITDSRGAMLSAGVAVLCYITFTWQKPMLHKLALWVGAGALLFAVVTLMSQLPQHSTGDVVRADLWRVSGDMIQTYPTGVGPGLFAQGYRQMGVSGLNRFADAHNHILTLGAELGAPGLAAGAVMLLMFLYGLVGLKLTRSQYAALAALMGIAAHLMVDSFPSDNFALLVGLYAAYVLRDAHLFPTGKARKILTAVTMVILLGWTWRMFQFDRAQVAYEVGLNTGRYYDAEQAADLDPTMALYHVQLQRLQGQDISGLDPDLALYGLTMYGRVFR